jgi:cysteine desulfurase/selenocysteine lyase
MSLNLLEIRNQFPALQQTVRGQPLVYLDSAATTLKPKSVIEVLNKFYSFETANVHRGAHFLSDNATEKFEQSRKHIQRFLGAESVDEVIFSKGTTDSINLVAQTFGMQKLNSGDEILLTEMEHHSNIVPWQIVEKVKGIKIKWAPVSETGEIDVNEFKKLLSSKTKLVSLVHCSNAIGTVNPLPELIQLAHAVGARVLVDAAQSITFKKIDVKELDCDFLAFSGHKIYGPYGIGILYAKKSILDELSPYQGGGAMISVVTKQGFVPLQTPQKFESGTPHISGVIGLDAAISFAESLGAKNIEQHEKSLFLYAKSKILEIPGTREIGKSDTRVNIFSFVVDKIHQSDIGQILDQQGIAVRIGHHCAQPLMERYGVTGTIRLSFGVYNSMEDVDILVKSLKKAVEMLT